MRDESIKKRILDGDPKKQIQVYLHSSDRGSWVAFFSGIQASSPDMRYSGDAYYDESDLMDIKVVGTMGLTSDDVSSIESIDGIESAEGAWSADVMCGEGQKQKVLHIESINDTVNKLDVQEDAFGKSGEIFWIAHLPLPMNIR